MNVKTAMTLIKKFKMLICGPVLLNYALPLLMVYLVAGTVAQKYIGLYDSTKIFFSAPLIWLGPVPLPGVPLVLALIFLNLSCKLIFKSPWHKQKAGTLITHIGAMFLLIGGLFTALYSHEGYMAISPAQPQSQVTDYHIRELLIRNEAGDVIYRVDHRELSAGQFISLPGSAARIKIIEHCRNCKITAREEADSAYEFVGMAQHMSLSADRLSNEDEKNMAGLLFAFIAEASPETIPAFVLIEDVPNNPEIKSGGTSYYFSLGRQKRELPFQVELIQFKREMHPGTAMAKAYSSRVRIIDGEARWESLISMNEPLRYKGYTFFQSSFLQSDTGEVSVLSVVWNAGRAFPYISGITMCLGLILHLFLGFRCKAGKAGKGHA